MVSIRLFCYSQSVGYFSQNRLGSIWLSLHNFSWDIEAKAGYAISSIIDIAAGFVYKNLKYAEYTSTNIRHVY